jgi:hypothetical protein
MGVPTSEVGYTSATTRRGDHEVHKGHVVALEEIKKKVRRTCCLHLQGETEFGSGGYCMNDSRKNVNCNGRLKGHWPITATGKEEEDVFCTKLMGIIRVQSEANGCIKAHKG